MTADLIKLAERWEVVPHVRTARSGRQRRSFTVERGTEAVLEGFSDEPAVFKRHREALEVADKLNKGKQ